MSSILQILLAVSAGVAFGFPVVGAASVAAPLVNPLLPVGADPWVIHHDGWYFHMHTTAKNLTLWKTRRIGELGNAEKKVVWTPPADSAYSESVWAPEIHHLDGKWYIYFSARGSDRKSHRVWVLENASPDPMAGDWEMKGKLATTSDKWAIDGSVFEFGGRRYFTWSGWEGDTNGVQGIYLASMKNPWTLSGERVRISSPTFPWEKFGDVAGDPELTHLDVNEGPEALIHGDRLFIVYSASACWTDQYCLGLLTAKQGADPMDATTWSKSPEPVLTSAPESKAFAPGHNSFFKSPDGSEDWILYHANPKAGQGCGKFRSPRAQRFRWRDDGSPDFGRPVPLGTQLTAPAGEWL